MKNNQTGFIGIGSVDISKHFDMMESRGFMDLQEVYRNIFLKNEKKAPI